MISFALKALTVTSYDTSRKSVLKDLPESQALFIYNDINYGMGNSSSLTAWYYAAVNGDTSGSSDLLRDYFHLSFAQI